MDIWKDFMSVRLFSQRFNELETQIGVIEATKKNEYSEYTQKMYEDIDTNLILGWSINVKNLIANCCGASSQQFKSFETAERPQSYESSLAPFRRMQAVFLAIKQDFEGGYITSLKNLVQAEVFDSELEQASELLKSGYISAAAVIAGTVLETSLRSLCIAQNIQPGKLDKMNVDLAKAGIHNVLIQKKITALAAIRNSAAHGKPEDFTKQDVENMIAEINTYVGHALS